MSEQLTAWHNLGSVSRLSVLVRAAVQNAARGLTDMIGRPIRTGTSQARVVHFDDMTVQVGDPESAMVGIYLLMEGNLSGQTILILSLASALNLADFVMDTPPGTATNLGDMERSALAEVGNLTVSYFLNAMATLTGKPLRPSPPAVMVDMLGAILNVVATRVGETSDDLLIIETVLQDPDGLMQARLWVLPDLTLQMLESAGIG
ncbi:MAG: chemotaxis protein CheC [Chloroflexota bacterium]|nr:chemotaxis protein CheC [Chloroflexota bacterium]